MNQSVFSEEDIRDLFMENQDKSLPDKNLSTQNKEPDSQDAIPIKINTPKTVPPAQSVTRAPQPDSAINTVKPHAFPIKEEDKFFEGNPFLVVLKLVINFIFISAIAFTVVNYESLLLKIKYYWTHEIQQQSMQSTGFAAVQENLDAAVVDKMYIPSISVDAPITWNVDNGSIQDALQNGLAHYAGTVMPGQTGNTFITGHSSYYSWAPGNYKSVFALLGKVEVGEEIYISNMGSRHAYRVTEKKVVKPDQIEVFTQNRQPNKNTLTLMTCTPVGTSINRLIVFAEEI